MFVRLLFTCFYNFLLYFFNYQSASEGFESIFRFACKEKNRKLNSENKNNNSEKNLFIEENNLSEEKENND